MGLWANAAGMAACSSQPSSSGDNGARMRTDGVANLLTIDRIDFLAHQDSMDAAALLNREGPASSHLVIQSTQPDDLSIGVVVAIRTAAVQLAIVLTDFVLSAGLQ